MQDTLEIDKLTIADTEAFCRFCMDVQPPPYNDTVTITDIIKGPIIRIAEGNEIILVLRTSADEIVGYGFLKRHPTRKTTWGFGRGGYPLH